MTRSWPFPWPEEKVERWRALRVAEPITVDGRLDEPAWQRAPRSPRFRDMVHGTETVHGTEVAVLWDAEHLYVGFWVEEPFVEARVTERDDLVYNDNDVELFVAGPDAYYELEINALGTIYEALFVWSDAYRASGFDALPGLAPGTEGHQSFDGVGLNHPRGRREGFFRWDLPGLRAAVAVDGTLNDSSDRDRGWTAEIAVPWQSLGVLTHGHDGIALPPRPGDVWRIDASRFNTYRAAPPAEDSGGWVWSPHGVWDSHVPELFTQVEIGDDLV